MFAHATGFNWDEALLIFGPIAIIIGLLVVARRKAGKATEAQVPRQP